MIWAILQFIITLTEVMMCFTFTGVVVSGKENVWKLSYFKWAILIGGISLITYLYWYNRQNYIWFSHFGCVFSMVLFCIFLRIIYKKRVVHIFFLVNFYYVALTILDYLNAFFLYSLKQDDRIFLTL